MKKIIWAPVYLCDAIPLYLNSDYTELWDLSAGDEPIYFSDRAEAESIIIMLTILEDDWYDIAKIEVEEGQEEDYKNWTLMFYTNDEIRLYYGEDFLNKINKSSI